VKVFGGSCTKPIDDLEQTKLFCGAAIDTGAKAVMVRNWNYMFQSEAIQQENFLAALLVIN